MNTESYRDLKVLEAISSEAHLTQRGLAQRLEVALGLTNLMIRRLVGKGYIKAVNIQRNRIRYLVTPKGIAEKTRLTYEYLEYSLYLYRNARQVLRDNLARVQVQGSRNIVLFGCGEIAEIAYLAAKELGLSLVAVVDEKAAGRHFLGVSIVGLGDVPRLDFDCGVISSFDDGYPSLRKQLESLGVSKDRLMVIERQGADVRVAGPYLRGVPA